MAWSSAVITNSGLAILPQLLAGDRMSIDAAGLAINTVDETALITQTALSSPVENISAVIVSHTIITNGIAIKLQIRNKGLASARTFKQVGLFATYNESQILFAIAQDDNGEEVPAESDYPDYMLEFTMAVAVSQTEGITVTVNPSAVITAGSLDEILKNYPTTEIMEEAIENATEQLSETIENKAPKSHDHTISEVTGLQNALDSKAPTSHGTHVTYATAAPKGAGTAAVGTSAKVAREDHVHPMQITINGHTVNSDVPANAKFTDTVYTHPSGTAKTGNPTANQTPAFGGTFTVTQFTSNATGHISGATDRTIKIPNTAASKTAAGLVTTGAQTFAGTKTFSGGAVIGTNASPTIAQCRDIYAGTTDMTAGTTALTTGAIYLVYE